MEDILFLVHRIPFPPNKGDKIRSFHLLKYLAGKYRVHLAAFIDNPADWRYEQELSAYCRSTYCRPLEGWVARLRSLRGFVTGKALSLPYYYDRRMQARVDRVLRDFDVRLVVCFSSVMCQYVSGPGYVFLSRVADFVDMDSDKWRQYSRNRTFPMNLVYAREAERLLEFEQSIAAEFDACLFVSAQEAKLFSRHVPGLEAKVGFFNNGVDYDRYDPARPFSNPFDRRQGPAIVFTGAMDYWANVDAVCWFAGQVLPAIRERVPGACFYVVGSNPAKRVLELAGRQGVVVTGDVADTRPYLAHADLVVAPLRIARGIQNKVLEALAMGKPVVLTGAALEGIDAADLLAGMVADDPGDYADACVRQLEGGDHAVWSRRAREFIQREYSWERNLARLDRSPGMR